MRVIKMEDKKEKKKPIDDLRMSPEKRLCNKFDATSVAEFPVAKLGEMGVRVADNCAEEHIM